MKHTIKAILFDYDGTLVDTESISMKLLPLIYKKHGLKMTKPQYLQLRSAGYPLKDKLLAKWYGNKFTKSFHTKLFVEFMDLFDQYIAKHPIELKPGTKEALKYLKSKHIPLIIVTATAKHRVEDQMKKLDIYKYVSFICSTETKIIKLGKPNPDVYLYAAKQAKLDPRDCLAVEDSPNGVISACRAGCKVIMSPDLTQPTKKLRQTYNFKVIKSLKELIKLFK